MPIDKDGTIIPPTKREKKKLNESLIAIIISIFSLIISIFTLYIDINGSIRFNLGYEGYTKSMFPEDIYPELEGKAEELGITHSIEEISYGVQEIYIDFMNTSKNPVYITDFEMSGKIGDETANITYRILKDKSNGKYYIDYKPYVFLMYGIEVTDFDDVITSICVNPGEFCRIYFEIKIDYPEKMYKAIHLHDAQGGDPNNRYESTFESRKATYNLIDAEIYGYIIEQQTPCYLYIHYSVNGNDNIKTKTFPFIIIPITTPNGFFY